MKQTVCSLGAVLGALPGNVVSREYLFAFTARGWAINRCELGQRSSERFACPLFRDQFGDEVRHEPLERIVLHKLFIELGVVSKHRPHGFLDGRR